MVIAKIDVEGHEINVLKGAKKLFNSEVPTFLLIEDFVNKKIILSLSSYGFYQYNPSRKPKEKKELIS